MAEIAAEFYVEVDGLTVDPAALGRSMTVSRDAIRARIDFPESADAFSFATVVVGTGAEPVDPRDSVPKYAVLFQTESLAEVRIVRVVINATSALSVEEFDSSAPGQKALYDDLRHELHAQAVELAEELCARLNLDLGQHWIAPRGELPRVVNMVELIDIDASRSFGVRTGSAGSMRVVAGETMLSESTFERVAESLRRGRPAADEMLLAEAKHLVEKDFPVAPERSVLLAAIAVELRIKRLLRVLADTPEQASALDLLLDNPRDWSMSVHGLFLKALPVFAMAGPEGLGPEHRALAKRVQLLFQSRNSLAHTGSAVSREEALQHVQSASDAFAFMGDLESVRLDARESGGGGHDAGAAGVRP